jgi:hypothetical protein
MTQSILAPAMPFPNIHWWKQVAGAPNLQLDKAEHFQKMSFRNRYLVAGPDGVISLSIPIAEGRQQRKAMGLVRTDALDKWQLRHWRTIQSAYNRSPYFEFYQDRLAPLFFEPYEYLWDFNFASIEIAARLLNLHPEIEICEAYLANPPGSIRDLRGDFAVKSYLSLSDINKPYYQVFADRTGFLPNLSIIDLLFNEGPSAAALLATR